MEIHHNLFSKIISLENLFDSWKEFKAGKRNKFDVQLFERNLEDNIFALHQELINETYRHSHYTAFHITDPKLRHIHKATVKDRIIHHAIHRIIYPIFNKNFIFDSFSCRTEKGSHRAINRLRFFIKESSHNFTKSCFILKCDIKKFFDSVDHQILLSIIKRKITNPETIWLLTEIVESFGEQENNQLSLFDFEEQNRERERERETALGAEPKAFPLAI